MTVDRPSDHEDLARFVIEREPGIGYQITVADGPHADQLRINALSLLDDLGQPNPKGPEESLRWLGPIKPLGAYVAVSVRLLPDGEARYQQVWFQLPTVKSVIGPPWHLLLCVVLGLAMGACAARIYWPTTVAQDNLTRREASPRDNPSETAPAKLDTRVASSLNVRIKLAEYLSQKGFAADLTAPVVEEKQSVRLIDNLESSPPPIPGIKLSNLEVARLLDLLQALEEWSNRQKKSSPLVGP